VVASEATTGARDASPTPARQLEQAMYVDEITAESAAHLHDVSRQAWLQAFNTVMAAMQQRFDHDAQHATPAERKHRVRVGIYFHQGKDSGHEAD
jgi:HD superfamily phosphohydrolase YqeK